MNHCDAEEHLIDFAEGVLDGQRLRDLTSHVQGCPDCQDWIEAFDIMASSARMGAETDHPSSQLIALCAVRAEEEFELDRSDLHQHLEHCFACRSEIELLKAALNHARPEVESLEGPRLAVSVGRWWTAAAAAGLIGIAITALLGPSVPHHERPDDDVSTMIASKSLAGTSARPQPGLLDTKFSEAVIDGERLIETVGTLTISETKIRAGAVVRIQAVEKVAFGNGFQIGSRTRVAVEVSSGEFTADDPDLKGG